MRSLTSGIAGGRFGDDTITLSVPGGLAGQLFAIGYAAWIASNRNLAVHIKFHPMGSNIGKPAAIGVLDSKLAKSLGLTFSEVEDVWPTSNWLRKLTSRFTAESLFRGARAAAFGLHSALREDLDREKKRFSPVVSNALSVRDIQFAAPGSTISGYPTDYRIIEESWSLISSMISQSGHPDFAHQTGKEDTVSVHWRLGDYLQNSYHGAVSWLSLGNCLKYANPNNMPVKIFTDSPEIAEQVIAGSQAFTRFHQNYEIVSGDIWSDLFEMTRSKVFVGSQSGVSFLAALALRSDNPNSETWLPDKWFLNPHAQHLFHHGPKTSNGSMFYPANLVNSAIPL